MIVRPHLRVPIVDLVEGLMRLDEPDSRYITRVHRRQVGDFVLGFDPESAVEADAEIVDDDARRCVVRVGPLRQAAGLPSRKLALVQAMGKGDKIEQVLRDATALGVTQLLTVPGERSQSRPGHTVAEKQERWRRIAVQVARQCGRGDIPQIQPLPSLDKALELLGESHICWVLDSRGALRLGALLKDLPVNANLALCVGPEGGWSPGEIGSAERAGAGIVQAWPHVLRTETAATALLGAVAASLHREES